ncbi:MAG: efflux RND transporter periplasmic adaptor subunit [Planctomycetota bacterium]|nr:efflux RND transporter periplasmic adaptor subunit [Planctomycetota bacterium]
MIRSIINFVLIVGLAAAGVYGVNQFKSSRIKLKERTDYTRDSVMVEPYTVQTVTVSDSGVFKGVTEAYRQTRLGAEIAGKATYVKPQARVGEEVKKGEVLVRLDTELLELDLERLKSSLSSGELSVKAAEADVTRLEHDLEIARENLEVAKRLHERNVELYQNGNISESDMDRSRLELLGGRKAVQTGEDALVSAKISIERAREELKVLSVQISQVEMRIEKSRVKAPFDGTIAQKNCEEGEYVNPASPLFIIQSREKLYFTARVPAEEIGRIRKNDVTVQLYDLREHELHGRIEHIGLVSDPRTRTYVVKVVLDNRKLSLRPGMFGTVEVPLPAREFSPGIPTRSVLNDGGESYVYVIEDKTAAIRYIETGEVEGGMVEVESGLEDGEVIATSGFDMLTPGGTVEFVRIDRGTGE